MPSNSSTPADDGDSASSGGMNHHLFNWERILEWSKVVTTVEVKRLGYNIRSTRYMSHIKLLHILSAILVSMCHIS